jgi:hypothetical protein
MAMKKRIEPTDLVIAFATLSNRDSRAKSLRSESRSIRLDESAWIDDGGSGGDFMGGYLTISDLMSPNCSRVISPRAYLALRISSALPAGS